MKFFTHTSGSKIVYFIFITKDIVEEIICDGEVEILRCPSSEERLRILPGTYYGVANENVCSGVSNENTKQCKDKEVHDEVSNL